MFNTFTFGQGDLGPQFAAGCDRGWDGLTGRTTTAEGVSEPTDANDPRGLVPDAREGTAGRSGKGLAGAACGDFGAKPVSDMWPRPELEGQAVFSRADCDADKVLAKASSTASGALVLQDAGTVLVSVARTWSRVVSAKTVEAGQVTAVAAGAEGIRMGPVFIAKAVSVAITKAKGRTGTAEATLIRRWCGISVQTADPDTDTASPEKVLVPEGSCIDPAGSEAADLLATLNQGLTKVRLSVPPANAETEADGTIQEGEDSPGGFQAVIAKHDDARSGDFAVNDDGTHTISALEAVAYNDGNQGRNRVVLQLAGVAAESRYGIHEIPDFGAFEDAPVVDEGVEEEAAPEVAAIADPGPAPAVDLPESSGEAMRTAAVAEAPREDITVEELLDDIVPTVAMQPVYRGSRGFIDDLPGPVRAVARALRDAIRLLVNSPAQFGLLFATFGLLAAPLYLGWRRRSFARALLS